MSELRARFEIERAFPELAAREVAFLGAGVDSEAYIVCDHIQTIAASNRNRSDSHTVHESVAALGELLHQG